MTRRRALLPGFAMLCIAGGSAVYLACRQPPPPAAPAAEPAVAPPPAPVNLPAPAAPPTSMVAVPRKRRVDDNPHGGQVQRERAAKPGKLTYPDGSTRDALNGVGADVTILWSPERPFAPIVGTFHDRGWDWYRHADGTLTTVQILEINGVPQVCPLTAHPEAAVPVAPWATPDASAPGTNPAPNGPQQPAK